MAAILPRPQCVNWTLSNILSKCGLKMQLIQKPQLINHQEDFVISLAMQRDGQTDGMKQIYTIYPHPPTPHQQLCWYSRYLCLFHVFYLPCYQVCFCYELFPRTNNHFINQGRNVNKHNLKLWKVTLKVPRDKCHQVQKGNTESLKARDA